MAPRARRLRRRQPVGARQQATHRPARARTHPRARHYIALDTHPDSSILNVLPATVEQLADDAHPALSLVRLNAGGVALIARITRRSAAKLDLHPGLAVWAQIKAVALVG